MLCISWDLIIGFVKELDFVLEVDNKIITYISYFIGTINDNIQMLMLMPFSADSLFANYEKVK